MCLLQHSNGRIDDKDGLHSSSNSKITRRGSTQTACGKTSSFPTCFSKASSKPAHTLLKRAYNIRAAKQATKVGVKMRGNRSVGGSNSNSNSSAGRCEGGLESPMELTKSPRRTPVYCSGYSGKTSTTSTSSSKLLLPLALRMGNV
jgi:hypothetical protein